MVELSATSMTDSILGELSGRRLKLQPLYCKLDQKYEFPL